MKELASKACESQMKSTGSRTKTLEQLNKESAKSNLGVKKLNNTGSSAKNTK